MISIILPASNEERLITRCLTALVSSDDPGVAVEVIVVANGCTDHTVHAAEAMINRARAKGWSMQVVNLRTGGKINALNKGDELARYGMRAYLDADVVVSPLLLKQTCQVLKSQKPRYASGRVNITAPRNWVSVAYAKFYGLVPFMRRGVPGCGFFAVNTAGRAKWGAFPDIISDDTFVRLSFAPEERHAVDAPYNWPVVEGFFNLVKVRRRQDVGVREVAEKFPQLQPNDDKVRFTVMEIIRAAMRHPVGFLCYGAVALAVRMGGDDEQTWSRGR